MLECDLHWSRIAVELSRDCPPSVTAYAVGAVIAEPGGRELARGRSRESGPLEHAEENALARLDPGADLRGATLYSSLEPCSSRRSRPRTCTELVIAAGIRRVVLVLREPPVFVRCEGVALLRRAGVEVVELPELADQVRSINAAVLRSQ